MDKFINIEAEASILGSIILNNNFLRSVEDILEPKHFSQEIHQELYEHILKAETLVSHITLKPFFEQREQKDYLTSLLEASSSLFTPRDYAKIVIELWKTQLLTLGKDYLNQKIFKTRKHNLKSQTS